MISGGTNYAPDAARNYRDPGLDPQKLARTKVLRAAGHPASTLLHTHVADHRALFERMDLSLGASTAQQRAMDTWERVRARATDADPDPELEAAYLQYGRYLMIAGSRGQPPAEPPGAVAGRQRPRLDGRLPHRRQPPDELLDGRPGRPVRLLRRPRPTTASPSCRPGPSSPASTSTTPATATATPPARSRAGPSRISTNIHGGMGWWWHPRRQRLAVQLAVRALRVHPGPRPPRPYPSDAQGRRASSGRRGC